MEVSQAIFMGSSPDASQLTLHHKPEFAFIGRSNVGKSSLINLLCKQSKLAHTSATPGKTQLINRFLVDDRWVITDLPGYGFAKVSKKHRETLERMITGYIQKAPEMTLLFVLVDCRHALLKIDLDFLIRLGEWGIPFALIFTKTDKLSATALRNRLDAFAKDLSDYWEELPPFFAVSSQNGNGRKEVLDYIGSILAPTV